MAKCQRESHDVQAYVPIIWDTIPLGIHTITVSGPGTSVDANFPVELLPQDSYRPNTSLKYTGDENPWKPNLTTPTPIVVTQVVIQTITIPVTPSNEQVKAQQDAVVSEHEAFWVKVIIGGIVGVLLLGYLYTVIRRWKRK